MNDTNNVNFASNLRWIANIPLNILFPDVENPKLSLTQFDIPEVNIGVTEASYLGYKIEVPTGIISPDTKEITFNYLLDSNLTTYELLYRWANLCIGDLQDVIDDELDDVSDIIGKSVPITVFILNEWTKPVFKIIYHDSWIKNLGSLSMSYQDEPEPLEHAFTVAYSRIEIKKIEQE